ncbi:hypothetical protein [Corynebacterium striatum]|uniref:hypothetical protein n=1 Tax=Corynebacterium striatum TaxID=43770 RepID=UPI003B5C5A8F
MLLQEDVPAVGANHCVVADLKVRLEGAGEPALGHRIRAEDGPLQHAPGVGWKPREVQLPELEPLPCVLAG